MALSDDLRERVVGAVVEGGMSRNAAAKRFGVRIASAVRWVARVKASGEISPAPNGGRSSGERFSSSVLWRFFEGHEITFKKSLRTPQSSNARTF